MPLPKLETQTFIGEIPSSKETFKFRPFLVGEQKILLFAFETGDLEQIYLALKDIIRVCILEPKDLNIDKMASFDVESMFLQLASRSVGEISKVRIPCSECGKTTPIELKSSEAKLKNYDPKANVIKISDNIGLKLRYPSVADYVKAFENADGDQKESEALFEVFETTIESIFDEKNVYPIEDYSKEEVKEFVDSLPISGLKQIEQFIEKTPYLAIDIKFKCSKCGTENKHEIKGIKNFF